MKPKNVSIVRLREALSCSWSKDTAYLGVSEENNPSLGNCYPTSRVVQFYFPNTEIVEGRVLTPAGEEKHFWNMIVVDGVEYHVDLTWQQFPPNSRVISYKIRDRNFFNDGEDATRRVELLKERVHDFLAREQRSHSQE